MAISLGFPLVIQGTLSVVNATALLVGSTFNCQLRADRFLPAFFILTPCWFPQALKQPRSEKSPRGCRCLLNFAHRQEKCFGCNRIFCKMVLSLNASIGRLWLKDPVGEGHAYSSSWFWKNKGGRKEPWNHKKGKVNSWV